MAIQMSTTVRNARLDAIEVSAGNSCSLEIRTGAQPANCAAASSGSILATINLPADWLAAAGSGQKAIAGTWQDASADAAGTAGHFRIYNSQATKDGSTCFLQGTCGEGSGDMSLNNIVLAAGQQFTVDSFTLTDGNV